MARISPFTLCAGTLGGAMVLKVSAFATAVAMLSLLSSAEAGSLGRPCTSAPESQWLSMVALQSKVEALGYKVRKAKLKAACGEMYTLDPNGARVELFVDPTNGTIVGRL